MAQLEELEVDRVSNRCLQLVGTEDELALRSDLHAVGLSGWSCRHTTRTKDAGGRRQNSSRRNALCDPRAITASVLQSNVDLYGQRF
jgi:hypothetical protein